MCEELTCLATDYKQQVFNEVRNFLLENRRDHATFRELICLVNEILNQEYVDMSDNDDYKKIMMT